MEQQGFLLDLMRFKFGFMACFHYIFVPLTLGLVVSAGCMETAFVWTRAAPWRSAAHFWFRVFTLGWLLGILTGYPLRAELESDWGNYFNFVKPVLDQVLPVEAVLGPIMLLGVGVLTSIGHRLYPVPRMLLTWGLALAMLFQSATILGVNAWMQHPTGIVFGGPISHPPTLLELMANPMAAAKMAHVFSAALVCGATFVCAVAALYLHMRQHQEVALVSLRLAIALGAVSVVLVIITGHLSAAQVERFQPMKFAALEGLWRHQDGPAGLILFARPEVAMQVNRGEIQIPYAMSVLAGYGLSGSPPGIREEVSEQERRIRLSLINNANLAQNRTLEGYRALLERERLRSGARISQDELIHRAAMRTVPNVPVLFGGFRIMVFVGFALLGFYSVAWLLRKHASAGGSRLLLLVPAILPLPWVASTFGWVVAEMGRQPWVVYGYLPTAEAARPPPLPQGVCTTLLVTSLYAALICLFVVMLLRLIRRGPGAPLLSASWWLRICAPPSATPAASL